MANNRGSFDGIDQIQIAELSGGSAAQQFVTTDISTKPNGASAIWVDGNLVSGGAYSGAQDVVYVNGVAVATYTNYSVNPTSAGFTVNGV